MPSLVFDIETIGYGFDQFDKTTQEALTWWAKQICKNDKEYKVQLKLIKEGFGLSPLTGEIVSIGVMDVEKNQGVVFYQAPKKEIKDHKKGKFEFKKRTEKQMLKSFWRGAKGYDVFVGFNSRSFDVPFIMARSAKHKIKPSKNLMSNRYLSSQFNEVKHIDLMDQFAFYGAVRKPGNLHLWCNLFNIKSPKQSGVKGDDVARLFKQKQYKKIAYYNSRDLIATRALYKKWIKYYKFN